MNELLEKWAVIEPERCKVNSPHPNDYLISYRESWVRPFWHVEWEGPPSDVCIQAATQEAIEARGWRWMLRGTDLLPNDPISHSAVVYGTRDGSKQGRQDLAREFGETAAGAILAAYLTALGTLMEADAH
jgi:hypothetical protein